MRSSRKVISVAVATAIGVAAFAGSVQPAQARTQLGTLYLHPNFRGNPLALMHDVDNYVCTSNRTSSIDHNYADLKHQTDQASSFQAFSGCLVRLFEDPLWKGTRTAFGRNVSDVGAAMDNRASSAQAS